MEYKVLGDVVAVRLEKGDSIARSLLQMAEKEGITLATVEGIGAMDDFAVGVFDIEAGDYVKHAYTGNHEINALVGNLSTRDGKPYAHLHVTATGRDGVVGGHLFEGVVSLTAEIFVRVVRGAAGVRVYDASLGINLLRIEEEGK